VSHLEDQKKLTDNKGWGAVLVEHAKDRIEQAKTHVENIIGGIKATPEAIKKTFKKED